jgi:hypothetical protein
MTQTVEQFLVEQLERVAPGKYALASVLQRFQSKLRFPCTHLKGGRTPRQFTLGKDYNLSIFMFPTGVTEIKCLYNCGLKIRSDEAELTSVFNELHDLPSTNTNAGAERIIIMKGGKEIPIDPGPVPVYTDAYRQRIKESSDLFWAYIQRGLEDGRIKPGDPILGAVLPHPDPIEAPDTIVERGLKFRYVRQRAKKVLQATAVVQDSIPEPAKTNTKIRKARKTNPATKRGGK